MKWLHNIGIALSQLLNAALGGDPDVTFSGYLGRLVQQHGAPIPLSRYPVRGVLQRALDWIDPGHCLDAIENDEDRKDSLRVER